MYDPNTCVPAAYSTGTIIVGNERSTSLKSIFYSFIHLEFKTLMFINFKDE